MTGLEHYEHAEALIREASKDGKSQPGVTALLARAQVHATLAMVWAFNRAQTEAFGLKNALLEEIREHREAIYPLGGAS